MLTIFRGVRRLALFALILYSIFVSFRNQKLKSERDRFHQNTEALLFEAERFQVDSTRMALDVKSLRLTLSEFQELRAEDAELIRKMGIRIKDLEAAAKHRLVVEVPIVATVTDTVIVYDSVSVKDKTVGMVNSHVEFRGVIHGDTLRADIRVPVTLNQAVWVEYRKKFLWWRWKVKAVHQTISCDNPYVEIEYSESIQIQK